MSGFRSPLWLLGISAGEALPEDLPYQGDATIYDGASATGSIGSGTLLAGDTTYDQAGATGSTSGGSAQPGDTIYDQASATGTTSGATVIGSDTSYG